MTYKELYESAADKLEKSKITLGEFEKMIEPLNAEIDTDSDTISRAKAIDGKICIRRSNGVEIYDDYVVPVEYLEQLPPAQPAPSQVAKDIARIVENEQDMMVIAQPEIIRCKDCKHWIPYDWMFSEVWQSKNIADYPEDEIGCDCCDMAMKANDFCSRAERREVTT